MCIRNFELPKARGNERQGVYSEWVRSPKILKNGTQSKKIIYVPIRFSYLNQCRICGVLKGAKWVQFRLDIFGFEWSKTNWGSPVADKDQNYENYKRMLCMSCYNKLRALEKKQRQADECRHLINLIKQEIGKNGKNKDDRRIACNAGGFAGAGERR